MNFITTVTKQDNVYIASIIYKTDGYINNQLIDKSFGIRQYKHCSSAHRAIRNYLKKLKGL